MIWLQAFYKFELLDKLYLCLRDTHKPIDFILRMEKTLGNVSKSVRLTKEHSPFHCRLMIPGDRGEPFSIVRQQLQVSDNHLSKIHARHGPATLLHLDHILHSFLRFIWAGEMITQQAIHIIPVACQSGRIWRFGLRAELVQRRQLFPKNLTGVISVYGRGG